MGAIKQRVGKGLRDPGTFRYFYLLDLLFCSVCFINIPANLLKVVFFPWAAVLIYQRFCVNHNLYKVRYWGILLLFLAVGALTTVLHIWDNFFYNVMILFHVAMCFFLFYGMHAEPNKNKIKSEIQRLMKTVVVLTTAFSVIGLLIVLFCVRIYVWDHVLGLMDNRFTGIYINPNPAAFASVVGLLFCHFLWKKRKENGKRVIPLWLGISCLASNLLALLLSDSNGSMVFLLAYAGVLLFYWLFQIGKQKKFSTRAIMKRGSALVAMVLVASFGMLGVRYVCQSGVGALVSGREQIVLGDTINPTAQPGENGEPAPKPASSSVGQVVIGRTDNPDISSGRFDSLGKAFQLFIREPVLGIGQGNIVEYGERYLDEGFLFEDLHNGYVTILVSYGIVGFLLVMSFLFVLARRIYGGLHKNLHKGKLQLPLLFAMLGAYCVYSLFDITLLLDVNFMVVIFWLLLGYATTYLLQYETRFEVITSQPFSLWKQKAPVKVPLYLLPTGRSYSSLRLMTKDMKKRDA